MKTLHDYILHLLARGRYFFSRDEALSQLALNPIQFRFQALRLSKKKVLRRLGSQFYMIIPAEYYSLGSLPPQWLIDAYMKHLNQDYYVGLLSAASYYGATNQQPMALQVITSKHVRPIDLPRGSIEFHVRTDIATASKAHITLPTGWAAISTKEQTLVDLVKFYKLSGYLSNVASVIKELAEECTEQKLAEVIQNEKTKSVLQRLGYLLERTNHEKLALIVEKELKIRKGVEHIPLSPELPSTKGRRNNRWKLILNNRLEIE